MKILFVYPSMMPFVERDLRILEICHTVKPLEFTGLRGVAKSLGPDLGRLWMGVRWADITFSWFGKLHAFFAVLFSQMMHKPSVVVSGGDDVANVPELSYGLFTHPVKRLFPLYTFAHTDLILCVSECNRRETILNARAKPDKTLLIYHGFDSEEFHLMPGVKREQMVLTVGRITRETLEKKGLRLFVEAAKYLPDVPFSVVGPDENGACEELRRIATPNVSFPGPIYGKELVEVYNRAKVYAQLSYGESFGCSIAEAMLCGCTPVLTRGRAIPEVGGDAAFYVKSREPREIASVVRGALEADLSESARERIVGSFPLAVRKEQLLEAVQRAWEARPRE